MTAEEYLRKEYPNRVKEPPFTAYYDTDEVVEVMEAYAKEQAMQFLENTVSDGWFITGGGIWRNNMDARIPEFETRSTNEHYDQWKEEQK